MHDRLLMPGLAESDIDHSGGGPRRKSSWSTRRTGLVRSVNGRARSSQHKWGPKGERAHRPVDREFAVVAGMAAEVARRINHRVIAVI